MPGELRRGPDRRGPRRDDDVRPQRDGQPGDRRSRHVRAPGPHARADAHLPSRRMTTTPAEHADAVEAWRRERYARLRNEVGWLTLAGLGWLRPGVNRVGSAPDADVVLPAGPPLAGTVTIHEGHV